MKKQIFTNRIFYHIYPLGMAGCPRHNNFKCNAGNFFEKFTPELDKLTELGINALYIGPLFESTSHGYDTVDYYYIDRRLGNNLSFKKFCTECHKRNIKVVVDTVFNHTGRDFFAFKDIQAKGENSIYKDWYTELDFTGKSSYQDNFNYQGWAGCMDLVKLNTDNTDVRNHLKGAVKFWIEEFDIDGLRLDAADVISKNFLSDLSSFCHSLKDNFFIFGEVVHGNYNDWANEDSMDSVTNYQIYKALWSSLNDRNMFELSYNLDREFGDKGMYLYSPLYNFVDNHDVNRIASTVNNLNNLYLVYGLLFMIPGIPSIYYHSEYGIRGMRGQNDDIALRPAVPPFVPSYPAWAQPETDSMALYKTIQMFATIRKDNTAIQIGSYKTISTTNSSLIFMREYKDDCIIIMINADDKEQNINIQGYSGCYVDLITGENITLQNKSTIAISHNWIKILKKC